MDEPPHQHIWTLGTRSYLCFCLRWFISFMWIFEKNNPAGRRKLEMNTFICDLMLLDHCDWEGDIQNMPQNLFMSCFRLALHEAISSTMLLVMEKKKKRRRYFHVSLQPAVISNISISSLWWHGEDSTFSGVIDVTQQQLRSFAARAAELAALVCGTAALLLELKCQTAHQSKGGLAPQLAPGLPENSVCGQACWCITGAVTFLPCFLLFPLLSYSRTWLLRESWRQRRERSWRR